MDTELLKSLGLEFSALQANRGKLSQENIDRAFAAMRDEAVSKETKHAIARDFSNWVRMSGVGGEVAPIQSNMAQIYSLVESLAIQPDDNDADSSDYEGKQAWASTLLDGFSTVCMVNQDVCVLAAPCAYALLGRLVALGLALDDQGPFVKKQASTDRCSLYKTLIQTLPHTNNVKIPDGAGPLSTIICGDFPKSLKASAKQALQSMTRVNKAALANSGMEIMNIIASGGNDDLIFTFLSMPELYTNNPDSVHNHIDVVLSKNWMHVCSLVNNVAMRKPGVLVPHVSIILDKLQESPAMGAVTIGILKEIAKASPETIFPFIDQIIDGGKSVAGGSYAVAGCIGAVSGAKNPSNAGDLMLPKMIDLLKSCETTSIAVCISELSNMKNNLSSREVLGPYMQYILTLKPSSDVLITEIEDFFAGRSLQKLEVRVDAIEVKITQLNNRVSEACSSFEDVIAYVDANIADLKDFVGDVVKKLPTPKRLEVVGTLRKTLILHFECAHTGYEYPIESKEWSKWLKMGFSLLKAGKAVIDIGMGNPIGLISTGVDCVKGIYDAYKTNDDDEFNTYITEPFLTSAEQDQLIEKLRAQKFFEVMAYDAQIAGWYLLNPEKDGTPPAGEQGAVTKVWKKEGTGGITEGFLSGAAIVVDSLGMDGAGLLEAAAGIELGTTASTNTTSSPIHNSTPAAPESKSTPKPSGTSQPGARAAAVRSQMTEKGNFNAADADATLNRANQMVEVQSRVTELEGKVTAMQKQMQDMQAAIDKQASDGGGCCTIA